MAPLEYPVHKRVVGWQDNLTNLISSRLKTPFEWGKHDCALWSADAANAVIGYDYGEGARATYNSAIGAIKCLSNFYKVNNLLEVYLNRFPQMHIALARPGDIVYRQCNEDGFDCMIGVCYGYYSFFIMDGEAGLTKLPTLSLYGAFRIG